MKSVENLQEKETNMENPQIKILLAEDNIDDQKAFQQFLKDNNLSYKYTIAKSILETKTLLGSEKFDALLINFSIGKGTAFDILNFVTEVPIIIIAGIGDEETAIKAMKSGADDYLIKDIDRNYLKVLPITVENAIRLKKAQLETRMLSHAIMSIGDGVYITDTKDIIIFANNAFCKMYGYKEEDILGESDSVLFKENNEKNGNDKMDIISDALQGIFYHIRKNGSEFPAHLTKSVINDEKGERIAVAGIVRDMTKQKDVEAEKIKRGEMQGVIEMAGAACHELNQPLQAISGFSDLLIMEIDEENSVYEMVQDIKKETVRLGQITRKLNNITQYKTTDYINGRKIIDIDRASKNRTNIKPDS